MNNFLKNNLHFVSFILLVAVIGFSVYAHSNAARSISRNQERSRLGTYDLYRITSSDTSFMKHAMSVGQLAQNNGNANSAGSIMVMNNEVIAEGWDKALSENDPTAHAEMEAVRAAGQNLKKLLFEGSVLYTTRKPCSICISVMAAVGVKVIYYWDAQQILLIPLPNE